MGEDPMIGEARKECQNTLKNLSRAIDLISEARDYNYFKEEYNLSQVKLEKMSLEDTKEEETQ